MTDAAREYAEALDAYNAALVRLRDARRHFDPKKTPEAIARTRAMAAANRAAKKAARNSPEAKARREQEMREHQEWARKWAEANPIQWITRR